MGQEKDEPNRSTDVDAVSIDIDIAKTHLDAHLSPTGCSRRFDNDQAGIAALIRWITPQCGSIHR